MMDRNAILKRMNNALAELHRCHAELGALESAGEGNPLDDLGIDILTEKLCRTHPRHRTSSMAVIGPILMEMASKNDRPAKMLAHIEAHHEWRCKYDFPTKPIDKIISLPVWLEKHALSPIPNDHVGAALLASSVSPALKQLSKREQEAAALQKEMGW